MGNTFVPHDRNGSASSVAQAVQNLYLFISVINLVFVPRYANAFVQLISDPLFLK